ncbi:bacteriocin [Clostridium perfringens]|uniref:bacteriocin n=1 Tax=Clostridium perfringens TaxID=1502 RepID=UPI0039E9D605|nr:bacteriocin [Clostridium perfringens]
MNNDILKKVSEKELSKITGGDYACKMAWFSCLHDTVLNSLGTSDPASKCEYARRVCSGSN